MCERIRYNLILLINYPISNCVLFIRHQPLDDIIDNTFIEEGRLERESAMCRMVTGNFTDPFKDIDEDYKEVKINLMGGIQMELDKTDKNDSAGSVKKKKEQQNNVQVKQKKKSTSYVPGIMKPMFKFPRMSRLNIQQQALCLRVLLRFSESSKPKLTQIEREELKKYMDLQKDITEEQNEFLEFAKSKWEERLPLLFIKNEDYVNDCWRSKLRYIHNLPRYYGEVTNIPFVRDKNIEVKFDSVCLQRGELPKITLPSLTGPCYLNVKFRDLKTRFPHKHNVCKKSSMSYKLPVSEDANCQKLAESNNADIVISSSGLNCLVNNIGPNYSNPWILPVVIKRHNDKNVIYIDKPGPPSANTIPRKNNWIYKYILKYSSIDAQDPTSHSNENHEDNNIFDDVTSKDVLKLEEECDNVVSNTSDHSQLNQEEDSKIDINIPLNVGIKSELPSNDSTGSVISKVATSTEGKETNSGANASYKLFTIGPQSSEKNELMKNVIHEYKMLVRTKTDGFQNLPDDEQKLLLLAAKLEYQSDIGAESVTLEEALKQWISLIFRPHTFLARVRISANTSEVLQLEQRTAMSINNEIKRLYNVKAEDTLVILHNVIETLSSLSPGRYVIRHTIRHGAFAAVYKEVDSPGKNVFDLQTIYTEKYFTVPNPPWIPLDKIVPTPMLKFFERMPVMFHPLHKISPQNRNSAKTNNIDEAKMAPRINVRVARP
ncbi:uncharacterized protein LOC143213566 isoform X2 [Lasioglossum baleicum]|uniref:uncharacterized protein LOC143213566 isoform X2 n=1 Tax=Lasioglossum baleicum TaxID=434251 RepID=UPI003FCD17BF